MTAASGYEPEPGIDFTEREWYVKAVEKDGIYYSTPYKDADSGRMVITISRKITVNTKLEGVLAEDIFIDRIVHTVNQSTVPDNSYAMLLDQNMGLVVHPNSNYGYVDPSGICRAILTVRWRMRLRPEVMKRFPWRTMTAWSGRSSRLILRRVTGFWRSRWIKTYWMPI